MLYQDCAAGNSGFVAQLGCYDLDSLVGAGHGVVVGGFNDDCEHFIFEGVDYAAAEDDDFWIEQVDDISDGDARVFGGFLDDFFDELVAAANGFAEIAAAHICQVAFEDFCEEGFLAVFYGALNAFKDCGAAGKGFEAASVSAVAFWSANFEHHVTDFTGGAVETGIEFAVQYESCADSCADKDADQMAGFGLELLGMDAQGLDVAVVLDKHRDAELFFQFLFEWDISPVKVWCENDTSGDRVRSSRGAHSDADDLFYLEIAFVNCIFNTAGYSFDYGVRAASGFGAEFGAAEAVELLIEDTSEDFRSSEVNANEIILI